MSTPTSTATTKSDKDLSGHGSIYGPSRIIGKRPGDIFILATRPGFFIAYRVDSAGVGQPCSSETSKIAELKSFLAARFGYIDQANAGAPVLALAEIRPGCFGVVTGTTQTDFATLGDARNFFARMGGRFTATALVANAGTSDGADAGWQTRRTGTAQEHAQDARKAASDSVSALAKGDERGASAGAHRATLSAFAAGDAAHKAGTPEGHLAAAEGHEAAQKAHQAASDSATMPQASRRLHGIEAQSHGMMAASHRTAAVGREAKANEDRTADDAAGAARTYTLRAAAAEKASRTAQALTDQAGRTGTVGDHETAAVAHEAAWIQHTMAAGMAAEAGLPEQARTHAQKAVEHQDQAGRHVAITRGQKPRADGTVANENDTADQVSVANEFNPSGDNWVMLSPFGDFPGQGGTQRVTREDAQNLVADFNKLANTPRRLAGLPLFRGHPDNEAFSGRDTDTAAYGRLRALQVRPDGLYGKVKWSKAGRELVNEGMFSYISTHWRCKRDPSGYWRPTSLKSAGLTNDPALPVNPIQANERGMATARA
jgi:hypothetical protein